MKYRKKPLVVEAIQLTKENARELAVWCGGQREDWTINPPFVINIIKYKYGLIKTDTFVSPGDWIVKDGDGEFHSCKPDIFEKTYEKKKENESDSK